MDPKKLAKGAQPNALGAYLIKSRPNSHAGHMGHAGAASSVRMADHHGRHIMLETTYRATVDGKRLKAPLMVGDDGVVHCHSLPNYQFASALDMVKAIVDQFPDEFPTKGNGHGHHTMTATTRGKKKSRKKPPPTKKTPKKKTAKTKVAKTSPPKKKTGRRKSP